MSDHGSGRAPPSSLLYVLGVALSGWLAFYGLLALTLCDAMMQPTKAPRRSPAPTTFTTVMFVYREGGTMIGRPGSWKLTAASGDFSARPSRHPLKVGLYRELAAGITRAELQRRLG
jgi:hypothetical protein